MILNKDVSFVLKARKDKAGQYMGYIEDMEQYNELKFYGEKMAEVRVLTFSLMDKEDSISLRMSIHLYNFNAYKFKPKIVLYYDGYIIFSHILDVDSYNEVSFNVSFYKNIGENSHLYPIMYRLLRTLRRYNMSKEFRILVYVCDI